MFDTDRLTRLRAMLSKARDVATAKAAQHTLAGEKQEALTQLRREVRLQEYEEALADAISTIKHLQVRERAKKAGDTARCTIDEWRAYAKLIGFPISQADALWDHFESNGWRIGGKAPMRCWQSAMRQGFRRWRDAGGGEKVKAAAVPRPDPDGWQQFLDEGNYGQFQYPKAPDWLKTEFRKWSNARK